MYFNKFFFYKKKRTPITYEAWSFLLRERNTIKISKYTGYFYNFIKKFNIFKKNYIKKYKKYNYYLYKKYHFYISFLKNYLLNLFKFIRYIFLVNHNNFYTFLLKLKILMIYMYYKAFLLFNASS
jgi:hypothetical protein